MDSDVLAVAGAAMVVGLVFALGGYVFMALALGAVFRKFGGRPVMAWIPIMNLIEMARIARTAVTATTVCAIAAPALSITGSVLAIVAPPLGTLLSILAVVPAIAVWVLFILQAHRLGLERGIPGSMAVVAALAPAIWAAVVGWSRMGTAPEPGPITGAVPLAPIARSTREDQAVPEATPLPVRPTRSGTTASSAPAASPASSEESDMDRFPFPVPAAPVPPAAAVPPPTQAGAAVPPPVPAPPAPPAPPAAQDDDGEAETRIASPYLAPGAATPPPFLGGAAAQGAVPAPPAPTGPPVSPYLTGGAASPPPPPPGSSAIPLPPPAGTPAGGVPVPPPDFGPAGPATPPSTLAGPPAPPVELDDEETVAPSAFAPPVPAPASSAPPAPAEPLPAPAEPVPSTGATPFAPVTPHPQVTPAALAHEEAEPVSPLPLPSAPAPWERAAPLTSPVTAPIATVAPQAADQDEDDDDDDHTQISVRRREAWELVTGTGEVYPLASTVIQLGRPGGRAPVDGSSRVEIVDPTKTISKIHARLVQESGRWMVEDLGSTNGTALIAADGTETDLAPHVATEVDGRLLVGDVELELRRTGGA